LTDPTLLRRAEAVRSFNRFFTQYIGLLHEGVQRSQFSLTEVRVLRELSVGSASTATEVARNLGLDSGYLSRLLTNFERQQLITRRQSDTDARQSLLALTDAGRAEYEPLEAAAVEEVCALLERLSEAGQMQLIGAMHLVERLLNDEPRLGTITLRAPRAGDYGWLVHRQTLLFGLAYGHDPAFEAFAAQEVADFARQRNRERAMCWIAEQDGAIVGSAFVCATSEAIGQVRLMFVEPEARRRGIGTRLIEESVRFAEQAGYTKLVLETVGALNGCRRLFERNGFTCVATEPERRFGRNLVAQTWERKLSPR
jgi:DNA-binding MarR family transcriptional regulator/GNAT superfamily N-acetyltransferase